jgi:hypothetical protein
VDVSESNDTNAVTDVDPVHVFAERLGRLRADSGAGPLYVISSG